MALQARITIRLQLETRPGRSEWFAITKNLFNQVAAFYFDVIAAHPRVLDVSSKEALTALERLTHTTAQNPDPLLPLSTISPHIPALFRRGYSYRIWWIIPISRSNATCTCFQVD
jgi:putative transposase